MVDTNTPKRATALEEEPARKRRWVVPIYMLAVLALAAAGGLTWFFAGEAPAEVDLAATASSVAAGSSLPDDTGFTGDIDGSWAVDTAVGSFTVDDTTTATFVGFRVEEVLNSIGSTTSIGRTPDVSGSITIEGTTLTHAEIVADLTSIVSDESRRDDAIQRSLNTSSSPDATFVLTEPIDLGEQAVAGELVSVTALGELTINGVSNELEVELEAQLIEGMVLVTGTSEVDFADYDVAVPTAPVVVSVEDHGTIELQVWLTR